MEKHEGSESDSRMKFGAMESVGDEKGESSVGVVRGGGIIGTNKEVRNEPGSDFR